MEGPLRLRRGRRRARGSCAETARGSATCRAGRSGPGSRRRTGSAARNPRRSLAGGRPRAASGEDHRAGCRRAPCSRRRSPRSARAARGPTAPYGPMLAVALRRRLAARAVPGSASGRARLGDRRAAALARLSLAAVHPELVLHPAPFPVRAPVVAKGRALPTDAEPKRLADARPQGGHFCLVELPRGLEGMDPRVPERLVRIDVPDPRRRPLVEQRRLDRRAAPGERPPQALCREAAVERLAAETPRGEVLVQLAGLEELPGPEAANVPVDDVRPVV